MSRKQKTHPGQLTLSHAGVTINQTVHRQIMNFGESERNESRTLPTTAKFTATQIETLESFSSATKIPKSTVISNALKLYFRFFDKLEKMIRYADAVSNLLENLP